MNHIKSYEEFLNESKSEKKYEIARYKDGNIKEVLGKLTVEEFREKFSSAIDDVISSPSGKMYKEYPETIEELLAVINAAVELKEKTQKPHTVYKLHK